MTKRIPAPSLIVLVGPSGAGKSVWASRNFDDSQIVSSDRLRGVVGISEDDQGASADAFELLDLIVERRLSRGLVTVVDTIGLADERREHYRQVAARHGVPAYAVAFDTEPKVCRARNKERERPVPASVLSSQIKRWQQVRESLSEEGFTDVFPPEPVRVVPADQLAAAVKAQNQAADPLRLEFGLQISSFEFEGKPVTTAGELATIAAAAEQTGFTSIWVMDHFRQIPQVGRAWEDMLESYTTLSFLAGITSQVRLGALVTGLPYRNPAHLGKIIATLDVLSGGRAMCGLGIGWFEQEATAYGIDFPPVTDRYALLEDTLQLLPLLWGSGTPAFDGQMISVPEAMSYPRPIQEHIPILVGGSGERKTLRLVARYADWCNLFGDTQTVRHKLDVLTQHCDEVGRPRDAITVSHLSTAMIAPDQGTLDRALETARPANATREQFAATVNAGTVEDHIGRFRDYAEAGVDVAIVNFPGTPHVDDIECFAEVIAAF